MAKKSGCGGVGCLAVMLLVGGVGYVGMKGCKDAVKESWTAAEKSGSIKKEKRSKLVIEDVKPGRDIIGSMVCSFTIRNTGSVDAADFHLEMDAFAPSGTRLNHKRAKLFEVVKAGEARRFEKVNFGTIDGQADRYSAPEIFECRFAGE